MEARSQALPSAPAAMLESTRALIELIQRGRMIVDVAKADLAASESRLGPFHETSWYFRQALAEARKSWERLRAEVGTRRLEQALAGPPLTHLSLEWKGAGGQPFLMLPIGGRTYQALRVPGTPAAPVQWRLTPLLNEPSDENGDDHQSGQPDPYYVVRLRDGSTQCDCAEWIYRVADTERLAVSGCKHIEEGCGRWAGFEARPRGG